jgi:putative addiction module killer protein
MYAIEEYVAANGKSPFAEWLLGLKDERAQAKIRARLTRVSLGNFGDWKTIKGAKNLFEMRDDFGAGYRLYYSFTGRRIILLLAGSTKRDQNKTIAKAKEYLADYERRVKP